MAHHAPPRLPRFFVPVVVALGVPFGLLFGLLVWRPARRGA
jgi:hypothetical protein